MAFSVRRQREFLNRHGVCVRWRRYTNCTCGPSPQEALQNCAACHGTGYVAMGDKIIRGIVSDAAGNRALTLTGQVTYGDLIFSQYPEQPCDRLEENDRVVLIEMAEGQPFAGEYVQRDADPTDYVEFDIASVQSVTQSDPDSGVVLTYKEGTDFTVSGNKITWIDDAEQPAVSSLYFVKYRPHAEYVVIIPPTFRYDNVIDLGQRVVLRRRAIAPEANEPESGIILG